MAIEMIPVVTHEVFTGNYIGDDTLVRTINLGFTPRWVLILQNGQYISTNASVGGLAVENHPAMYGSTGYISVAENGFTLTRVSTTDDIQVNVKNQSYNYIAGK